MTERYDEAPLSLRRRLAECCGASCPLMMLFSDIDLGILVVDLPSGRPVFANRAATALLDNDISQGVATILDASPETPDATLFGETRTFSIERAGKVVGYTLYDAIDGHMFVVLRDITERKRLEAMAEAMNNIENIGYIFAGIRHEIGNPINSTKMAMTVLRDNLDNFSGAEVSKYVDRALLELSRVEYLLKSLRNFGLFEEAQVEVMDLEQFFNRLIALASEDFEASGITITTEFRPNARFVEADSRALHQVILNLLTNASDALEARSSATIHLRTRREGDTVLVDVQDNGCGVPEYQVEHLFKPFYTSKPKGTGLGLLLSRKMVLRMGGNISVQSEEGEGTTVTVLLRAPAATRKNPRS